MLKGRHTRFVALLLVLGLTLGLVPTNLVMAAEEIDVTVDYPAIAEYDTQGSDVSDSDHYWDYYGWDETFHLLVCKCGVNNCPLAGEDSRRLHDFGEWLILKEATVTEEGLKHRSCWCGYEQQEVIPKIPEKHNWVQWGFDDEYHWYVCGNPDCTLIEHGEEDNYGKHAFNWSIVEEATTTNDGLKHGKCTCGAERDEVIPKIVEEPEEPEQPEEPDNPGETTPEEPGEPDESEKPGETVPDEPSKPEDSEKPDDNTNGSESNNNGGNSTSRPNIPVVVWPPQPIRPVYPIHPEIERPIRPIVIDLIEEPEKPRRPQIKPVKVYQITITNAPKKLKVGKKVKLKVKCDLANLKNRKITWKSSNCKYATVNKNGVVTAKRAGKGKTVKITAIAKGYTAKNTLIRVKVVVKIKIK